MAEVKVPELAESITEGTIAEWLKNVGDNVDKGEAILELETDKVNVEVVSEEAGVLSEQLAEEGDTVEVGQAVAVVGEGQVNTSNDSSNESSQKDEAKEKETPKQSNPNSSESENTQDNSQQRINATPSARRHARKNGVDLSEVSGKGNDVLRKDDVENSQKSSSQTAMLTTFNEVDMTNVMDLRKRKKEQFIKDHDGTKLGFMSFFTKAAVAALKKYPEVNAEIDGDDMITKQFYDIGIAVSTDDGLLVPFVRDCDKKNFAEIEQEIANLAVKARDKKLGLDDMVNGSFTITNGGIFGSMMSTPIINGNQAAILGMHSIITRPIAVDKDTIENRPMMYIALSYDHRIIDGKEAVGFLKTIKELIENPEDLLLES